MDSFIKYHCEIIENAARAIHQPRLSDMPHFHEHTSTMRIHLREALELCLRERRGHSRRLREMAEFSDEVCWGGLCDRIVCQAWLFTIMEYPEHIDSLLKHGNRFIDPIRRIAAWLVTSLYAEDKKEFRRRLAAFRTHKPDTDLAKLVDHTDILYAIIRRDAGQCAWDIISFVQFFLEEQGLCYGSLPRDSSVL
jgi:hypothetical protein